MPTYQYACTACGEKHEAVQSFTDAPLAECPACGGALRKVFSAVGVVFKGSGFYKNDSRKRTGDDSGSSKEPGKESAKEPAAKSDSTATKSDTGSSSTPAKSESSSASTSTPAAKSA